MTTQQNQQSSRYIIVNSNRFYGHYDVLDTQSGKREPCGNIQTARQTVNDKNNK